MRNVFALVQPATGHTGASTLKPNRNTKQKSPLKSDSSKQLKLFECLKQEVA